MIGQTISHYKILEKLGEGGMGVVYKAHDTRLDRLVALKFLPGPITADAEERERFYHEARAVSQLMHPNVTAIFEISESDDRIYLAMEHVDGRTLKKLILDEQTLSVKKALDIATQICAGLSAAHEKGIVHRDIKSENVLVNGKGEVKITDFGLAKLKGASKLTKAGSTLGTAAYMSPEQARGEDVDARSDIFSAGVVLYELLTGKLPFRGEHQAAVLYSLVNEDPPPLSRFTAGISGELQRIVSKALAKDKEDRYQHADEMLADLRRERKSMEYARTGDILQQSPGSSSKTIDPAGSPAPSPGPRSRIFGLKAGIIAGVILLAVAIGVYFQRMSKNQTPTAAVSKIAVLPFENLGPAEREYFADGLTDEIRTKLSGLSGLAVIARASSMQYKKTAKPISDIGNELNVGYLLEGTIRWETGDSAGRGPTHLLVTPTLVRVADGTQVWSQSFEGTLSGIFEIQSDIARQVARSLEVVLKPADRQAIESKPTDNAEAYDYFIRGQQYYQIPTVVNLKQAIAMFTKAAALDPGFTDAEVSLVRTYAFWNFNWEKSDSIVGLAKTALDRVLALAPNSFQAYLAQGYYYYYGFRDYDQAIRYFTLALGSQPNNADIISSIGYVKRRQGKFQESLDLLTRACDLDPKSSDNWMELGDLEATMRRYARADEHLKRAFLVLGRGSTFLADMHSLVIGLWKGDIQAAHQIFENESDEKNSWLYKHRSFQFHILEGKLEDAKNDLSRSVLQEPDIDFVNYYSDMGSLFEKSSQHAEARTYYDSARILAEAEVRKRPGEWNTRSSLGIILAHLGQKTRAIEEGKKAVELMPMERDALEGGPDAIYSLAQIYALTGEYDAALDKLEMLLSIPCTYSVNFIRFDTDLESLRSLPRFQQLLDKYKIE